MHTDKKSFLQPISAHSPCGEDLSFSPEFDRIQEARREDDPTIDYGEWQSTLKQADWDEVVRCCTELLQEQSKDLRLAAWLTEGLVQTAGFGGLADGIETIACLLDHFGKDIHPQAEGDDQEQRIGTLSWYVGRMSQLVRQVPLTRSVMGQFSLNDYESARLLQLQLERNADQITQTEDKITLERFSAAAAKTDKQFYATGIDDAERCLAMLGALMKVCDQLFGVDGPSFSPLEKSLDAVQTRLQAIASDFGLMANANAEAGHEVAVDEAKPMLGDELSYVRGPIKTRAQALESLREVATFFRNTEPHSPVAYLADKAARWGMMPLHTWLRAVVKDNGTLSHIEELLGLEMDKEKSGSDD